MKTTELAPARKAILVHRVQGQLSIWPNGLLVLARQTENGMFLIERRNKKRGNLPGVNQLAGVPREFLKFSA